jgi:hypothetical protein
MLLLVKDSLALTILIDESNEDVCLLEFECLNVGLDESFSTFCNRSGMSIVLDLFD